jgi:hypothetical protein
VAGEKKTLDAASPFVPADEQLLGAFVGMRGPRPGAETLIMIPFLMMQFFTTNRVAPWIVAVLGFAAMTFARTYVTVVRTDRSLFVIETGRRARPGKQAEVKLLPASARVVVDASGDPRAVVAGEVSGSAARIRTRRTGSPGLPSRGDAGP